MIEIKIPTSAAVILLTERMRYELDMRDRAGKINSGSDLKDLEFDELLHIAETSAFDMVFLLPAEILSEQNNLADIIWKAIQSLTKVFGKEEFNSYNKSDAIKLLKPIGSIFQKASDQRFFYSN